MDVTQLKLQSEESIALPLSTVCHPKNAMINIVKGHQMLIVYEASIPKVGSHYAGVYCKETGIQYCIARPFDQLDEAKRIYGRLIRCKHPNILYPLGIWVCEHKVKWKPNTTDEKGEGEEKVIEAFITFPLFDGALVDVPKEDIFLVEDIVSVEKNKIESTAYGFTSQGSRIFCDILGAVKHINGLYECTGSAESSSANNKDPLSLCSLRFNPRRIVYMKLAEREYKVLLWVDFFTESQEQKNYKKEPRVEQIWSANWKIVATYLSSLWRTLDLTPNEELKQLVNELSRKILKGEETMRYNNLLWEPGLWTVYIKIHFIREVFWSFEKETAREILLKSKTNLGLQKVITKLGFSNSDNNLYESIMFLRKKIVAHQDSAYDTYSGKKADVGIDKTTIEIFVQKINPEYMIKLVKEIRQLNWIKDSPLLRSETTYMEPFKPKRI